MQIGIYFKCELPPDKGSTFKNSNTIRELKHTMPPLRLDSVERIHSDKKAGKHLFYEYNLIWQYYLKECVSIWAGASYLTAGDAIKGVRVNPLTTDAG